MRTDIGKMLEQSANRFGNRTATVYVTANGSQTRSFETINTAANRVGNGLLDARIGIGDAVGLFARNSPAFVDTFFATQKVGARITPLNVRFEAEEVRYVVEDADLDCVIVERELLESTGGLRDVLDDHEMAVYVIGGDEEYAAFEELEDSSTKNPGVRVGPDAVDGYFYTSGSTGDPKGVVHTHSDRIFINANVAAEFGVRRSDVNVNPLPLFHSGPLYTGFVPFVQFGVPTVYFREFDPERVLEAVEEHGGTILGGVPAQYNQLVDVESVRDYDRSSLRFWWVSGAPLTEELRERCRERLCDCHSIVYGSTEAGPPASILPPEESAARPSSCGTGLMAQTLRVVEPDGDPDPDAVVPDGETGELVVKGESVMERYLGRPETTARSLVDGWYFTGDLARRDDDGYYYIEGRKDDMIISGGENISPTEVEDVLNRHEAIEDVAVIGVPHDEWGETPKAFLVTKDSETLTAADVDAFCKESSLADYKRPREVAFVPEIPRNPSGGSILRDELKALAE